MARYIDADDFGTWLANEYFTFCRVKTIPPIITAVHKFPAADVKPVVHAHWAVTRRVHNEYWELECSNCGAYNEYYGGDKEMFNKYCYECGAKMDKETDND